MTLRNRLILIVSVPVFLGTLFVASQPVGPLPALGPFLEPTRGVWSMAGVAELPDSAFASIPGMEGNVNVVYDDRAVPHIFAESRLDAVRALGYVVARDRLFQLDLQTRATAGTLTEIVGDVALSADQQSRRLGLAWSAEQNFSRIEPGSDVAQLMTAYADGINAWIDGLDDNELPLEYRLLGAQPQRWEPQHALYLLKRMGWTLSYNNLERRKAAAASMVGMDAANALFPVNAPIQEPIQTNGTDGPRVEAVTLPPPGTPDVTAADWFNASTLAFESECATITFDCSSEDVVGSNNWAIGPLKSVSGNAILSGDPHLNLTLPSIWYEVHLVVPDYMDVYGVVIPGTPGIVIGFNRDVAWSFTNTGADVMDFYEEQFDDLDDATTYLVDDAYRPLGTRIEEYKDEKGRVIAVDTIYHTHRGPVFEQGDRRLSLRWTVLDDQGEFEAFDGIATARTVDEWLEKMESYVAPAQNGIVADRQGSIAIRSHGRFPDRDTDRPGDMVLEGTNGDTDWTTYWPVSRYPFSIDPPRGFLSSANQQPIDPRAEPAYYGAQWPAPWRAMQINSVLRQDRKFTADDMRLLQTNAGSARANYFLPHILNAGERVLSAAPNDTLLGQALRLLSAWDGNYTKANTRAVLFEQTMTELGERTWDELDGPNGRVATPSSALLGILMNDSTSRWWDNRATPTVENRDSVVASSLRSAFVRTRSQFGPEDGEGWLWSSRRTANIRHLLQIPALSALNLPVQGGPSTISPSSGSGTHGASWRMVVELGPSITAWTTYPGGQSGNPISPYYRDRIEQWMNGELAEVLFPERAMEIPEDRILSRLRLIGDE